MKTSRFERKIILAILAVALMPLLGALVLGRQALRESYEVGINRRVEGQLDRGVGLYKEYIRGLRSAASLQADILAARWPALRAEPARLTVLVEGYPTIAEVLIVDANSRPLFQYTNATTMLGDPPAINEERFRPLTLERQSGTDRITVTVVSPRSLFIEQQLAGEVLDVYARLETNAASVSGFYLTVYIAFLISVITTAVALGLVLSRRVTRRIVVLAEAAQRIGTGDLDIVIPTDATDEIDELTRSLNQMVRDLRDSRSRIEYLRRIGAWQDFARRLAHEIKNPLTPIQLAIQEVHRSYKGQDANFERKLGDAATIIQEEVDTLRRLVGEFSAFSKLPEAQLTRGDLTEFMADLARSQEMLSAADRNPIALHWSSPPGTIDLDFDAMMLRRALDNLIRNASEALREGKTPSPRVDVTLAQVNRMARIEVRDNGPGIRGEELERVFDPYYTTKSEGTGLGLAIVKKIVLEHHGSIACVTSPLGGACFIVDLPMPNTDAKGSPAKASQTKATS